VTRFATVHLLSEMDENEAQRSIQNNKEHVLGNFYILNRNTQFRYFYLLALSSRNSVGRKTKFLLSIMQISTNVLSESKLLYGWRFTANQFVLATSPLRITTSNFISL
jgi:hypothetical protein